MDKAKLEKMKKCLPLLDDKSGPKVGKKLIEEIERLQGEVEARDKALEMKGERFPQELIENAKKILKSDTEYDSRKDTLQHIEVVRSLIGMFIDILQERATEHDSSKLHSPEKEVFDRVTPLLKELEYGSDEYKETLKDMGVALDHHYQGNRHHPEFYADGIEGMNCVDLIEMLCDWDAARLRHDSPKSFEESLQLNINRFKIPTELVRLLQNTYYFLQAKLKE